MPAARTGSRSASGVLRGGIDLGGTKIEAIVVNARHKVLGSSRRPTPTEGGPADVATQMAQAMTEAAEQAGVAVGDLSGIGVGSPGTIDPLKGTVTSARNLPGWEGSFALSSALSKQLGPSVKLGNDVGVATNAEYKLGIGKGHKSLLGVFWGTGVGGGLVLNGKPWHGRGAAGEIGHMVIKRGGRRCPCGREGCMEAYAGRAAMEAYARKEADKGQKTHLFKIMEDRDRTRFTSAVWWHAIEKQDKLATAIIDGAIEALGAGIASAANLLDPEVIVIGGGLGVRFGEPYVEKIREAMLPHLFVDTDPVPVKLVALGDLGGALGAALLVSAARS